MVSEAQYGLFGKLPVHGDFVHRNLSTNFISCWDEWLQHYIGGSREQLGDEWLDIYLTSPIWRFVLSPGVVDENAWAGIVMPSVDQVGRYYPFSVLLTIPAYVNPLDFLSMRAEWYANVEKVSLRALEGDFDVDEVLSELKRIPLECEFDYSSDAAISEGDELQVSMEFEEQSPSFVYSYFLDVFMKKLLNSYSMWHTQGSERIETCVFSVQGLPSIAKLPAMLDGQWEYWGWQQIYKQNDIQYHVEAGVI